MTKDEARERLLEWCPPGTTIYNVLEHRSQSGMSRDIKSFVFYVRDDVKIGDPISNLFISGAIGKLLDMRRRPGKDGIYVTGGGMDMGFHLVYNLSLALHGDGYALNARWL